jgi:hypothetical protein
LPSSFLRTSTSHAPSLSAVEPDLHDESPLPTQRLQVLSVPPPSTSSTLYGALSRAEVHGSPQTVEFTIGGIVLVDGIPYGLTTSHSFQLGTKLHESNGHEYDVDESDTPDDIESNYSSPYVHFNNSEDNPTELAAISPSSTTSYISEIAIDHSITAQQTSPAQGNPSPPLSTVLPAGIPAGDSSRQKKTIPMQHIGITSGTFHAILSSDEKPPLLDWALIELDEPDRWSSNSISAGPSHGPVVVSSIMKTECFDDSEVLINAGASGPTTGWLRSCPVDVQFDGVPLEVRQIVLDKPLGKRNKSRIDLVSSMC